MLRVTGSCALKVETSSLISEDSAWGWGDGSWVRTLKVEAQVYLKYSLSLGRPFILARGSKTHGFRKLAGSQPHPNSKASSSVSKPLPRKLAEVCLWKTCFLLWSLQMCAWVYTAVCSNAPHTSHTSEFSIWVPLYTLERQQKVEILNVFLRHYFVNQLFRFWAIHVHVAPGAFMLEGQNSFVLTHFVLIWYIFFLLQNLFIYSSWCICRILPADRRFEHLWGFYPTYPSQPLVSLPVTYISYLFILQIR